jgi:hypothetical protein
VRDLHARIHAEGVVNWIALMGAVSMRRRTFSHWRSWCNARPGISTARRRQLHRPILQRHSFAPAAPKNWPHACSPSSRPACMCLATLCALPRSSRAGRHARRRVEWPVSSSETRRLRADLAEGDDAGGLGRGGESGDRVVQRQTCLRSCSRSCARDPAERPTSAGSIVGIMRAAVTQMVSPPLFGSMAVIDATSHGNG